MSLPCFKFPKGLPSVFRIKSNFLIGPSALTWLGPCLHLTHLIWPLPTPPMFQPHWPPFCSWICWAIQCQTHALHSAVGSLSFFCFDGGSGFFAFNRTYPFPGSIPGWGKSPGGGHGDSLQYSCLENAMDRGVWRTTYSPWGGTESDMDWSDLARRHLFLVSVLTTAHLGWSQLQPEAHPHPSIAFWDKVSCSTSSSLSLRSARDRSAYWLLFAVKTTVL